VRSTLSVSVLQSCCTCRLLRWRALRSGSSPRLALRTIRRVAATADLQALVSLPVAIGFMTAICGARGIRSVRPLLQLSHLAYPPGAAVLLPRLSARTAAASCCVASGPAVALLLLIYWSFARLEACFVGSPAGLADSWCLLSLAGALLVTLRGPPARRVGSGLAATVSRSERRRSESLLQIVAFGTGIMVAGVASHHPDDLP